MTATGPSIVSINRSDGGIPKTPQATAAVTLAGIAGDEHDHEKHYRPEQAICMFDVEMLVQLRAEGYDLAPGTIGENLTVTNLDVQNVAIGSLLEIDGGVVLEVTKRRKPCYVLDSIDPTLKDAIRDRCGTYARVLTPGTIDAGAAITVVRPAP
ncbi:MAG: MOSC domain-containing protein [Planctomycetota bacterium]